LRRPEVGHRRLDIDGGVGRFETMSANAAATLSKQSTVGPYFPVHFAMGA
jgi:hypothetical protein